MTFRSLLVDLCEGPHVSTRVRVALRLARELEAQLVGLAPTGLASLPATIDGACDLFNDSAIEWQALRQAAKARAERFIRACDGADRLSFESIVDEAAEAASLIGHARCSDLVIMGQADPARREQAQRQAILEHVLIESARPVLVVPCTGATESLGQRVLVAWDGSRAASRAVADAMPLLQRAGQVRLVTWNEGETAVATALERLTALGGWLARHGVQTTQQVETASVPVGDALLSLAFDQSCDLIVLGAYGHSRWTERLLGGTTRLLLRSMTVPVLMSH